MFVEAKFFHKAGEGSGGGGGSDPHNLGYYADLTALQTAHPTGTDGDFAILGSTDTIWVWDSGTSAWKDTDTKGQVTSVNNQTGAVTVQETLVSGSNIKSVNNNTLLGSGNLELSTYLTYPAGWTTNSTTKAFCDLVAADTSAVEGKAYLGEVTFSDLPASMANGEVVVEIMDGTTAANKVIVLTLTSGNTAPYMWKYTYWNGGTDVSGWQTWATSAQGAKADTAVQPGDLATVATTGAYSDLTGTPTIPAAQVNSDWNASSGVAEILNKPTLAAVATSGAYADLSGTPSIPTKASDVNAVPQLSTLPTAGVDYLGQVVQFVGTTDANYTHGYIYECVSDGGNPATYSWSAVSVQAGGGSSLPSQTGNSGKFLTTDGTDPSWATISALQNTATGTDSLTINGNVATASYATNIGTGSKAAQLAVAAGQKAKADATYAVAIGANSYNSGSGVVIGYNSTSAYSGVVLVGNGTLSDTYNGVCIGHQAGVGSNSSLGIAIGYLAKSYNSGAIQIGSTGSATYNSDSNTLKIANANGNFEMMSADGTIPTDRYTTTPSADGTYVPTLTISSGTATRTWAAPGGGGSVPTLTWYSVSTAGNTLTIADTSSAQLVKIYKNGLLLQPTDDYTISGTTLTTVAALVVGDKITTEVF